MNQINDYNPVIFDKHEREKYAMDREEFKGANQAFENLSSQDSTDKKELNKLLEAMKIKEQKLDQVIAKQIKTIARTYADVCLNAKASYWQYEKMQFKWGNMANYEIERELGRGKFGEAYIGYDIRTGEKVCIKALKPIPKIRIKKELKILEAVNGEKNIIKLYDVCRDPMSRTISQVYEYINNFDHYKLFPQFTDFDIRFYIHELLVGIDACHSKGIIHRDVKPLNTVYDYDKKELRIIDWGLADFYFPEKIYSPGSGTPPYKAPELLSGYIYSNYAIDIWAIGAILVGLTFKREPFFRGGGRDDAEILERISRVLGTDEFLEFCQKYGIKLGPHFEGVLEYHHKKSWKKFIRNENRERVSPEALDLMDQIMIYDPNERLTAKEALEHDYFTPVKEFYELKEIAEKEYEEQVRQKELLKEKKWQFLEEKDANLIKPDILNC